MNSQQFYQPLKGRPHTRVIRVLFKTRSVLRGDTESYPEQKSIFFLSEQFTSHELEAVANKASGGIGG
jgi:hypothetical protein